MQVNNFIQDLTDPITHELFEDPINLTCCGKVVSRPSLMEWMNCNPHEVKCPLCNADITDFDAENAPRNLTVMGLVDSLRQMQLNSDLQHQLQQQQQRSVSVTDNGTLEARWTASLEQLVDLDDKPLPIGELKIELQSTGFVPNPTAFIIIADRSGSMAGSPFEQVKTALLNIFRSTHSNPHVRTTLITYDTRADIVDTIGSLNQVEQIIMNLRTGGSTHFSKAFKKVEELLKTYEYRSIDDKSTGNNDNVVSNVVITLLTDGQDNSGEKVAELPEKYRQMLRSSWAGQLTVHTIGFSRDHDFNFLENLRLIGTMPGMYRYAEPQDDGDTLCSKMVSLFDAISASSSVTTQLELPSGFVFRGMEQTNNQVKVQFPVDRDGKGSLSKWIMMPRESDQPVVDLKIDSEFGSSVSLPLTITQSGVKSRRHVVKRLMVSLVDELAANTLDLSGCNYRQSEPNAFDLHCALLMQHARAISGHISDDTELEARLDAVLHELEEIRAGKAINRAKLSDLKFASQVASVAVTTTKKETIKTITTHSRYVPSIPRSALFTRGGDREWNSLIQAVAHGGSLKSLLSTATHQDLSHTDRDGNTVFHWACYVGHRTAVTQLLEINAPRNIFNQENYYSDTPLALAVKNNRWKTVEILLRNGFTMSDVVGNELLKYVLQRGFLEVANLLLDNNFADSSEISDSDYVPSESIKWLMQRTPGEPILAISNISTRLTGEKLIAQLKMAVNQGLVPIVTRLIVDSQAVPDAQMLLDSIVPNSADHVEVTRILLENGKANPNGDVPQEGGADTPLFYASSKGALEHVRLLINSGADLERTNEKGNTPLWIAACNGHNDIVAELLNAGADANHANTKGDNALVPAIQKGHESIVLMLMMRGADVEQANNNGDTPVLIACRNGQAKILETLLSSASSEAITHRATIDGFDALFASVESDFPDCIQVLHSHNVDLNEKTDVDNEILRGGTPLHLAALYNRIDSARTLIQLGADINSRDAFGATPLHYAVKQNHPKFVQFLRLAGSDFTVKDVHGYMASFYVNNSEIEKELSDPAYSILMKLASGEFPVQEEKRAYDILARNAGCIGCLETREAVDLMGPDGNTPLITAVIHSRVELVKILLQLGADPYRTNLKGLSAYFWSEYVNNRDIKRLLGNPPDTIKNQLSRVRQSGSDVNNGLCLFLNGRPQNPTIKIPKDSTFMERNNMYIGLTGQLHTDSTVKTTGSVSLISWNEKLSSSKLWPHETKMMNLLLWKAKEFIVGTIASGSVSVDLEPLHILSIFMYTSPTCIAKLTNNALVLQENMTFMRPYIQVLEEALKHLPIHSGECFRGTDIVFDRNVYAVGKEVTWPTFSSASLDWSTLGDFKKKKTGTVFIVHSKSGRLVRDFALFPQDGEVVFAPGTRFNVLNWYKLTDSIVLQQKNIRQSAYGVKSDEVDKFKVGNTGLVIELEEI